ncbi:MAG: hypothetical protein JJE09_14880, partial [Bacteroidia bacterium]|nr:hypothetical protein [Bacteroidia bacterium]
MVKTKVVKIFFIFCLVGLVSCTRRNPIRETSGYTQIDSLTETYLNLQDSLLITWNVMVKDENEKLRSMDELLTMMQGSGLFDKDQLT